jgi:hypothetical protein
LKLILALLALASHAPVPAPERLNGGASADPNSFYTWGSKLRSWNAAKLTSRVIADGPFGEGGCTSDLDGDGRREVTAVRGEGLGALTWFRQDGTSERIDDQMEVHDCLEATLLGRHGLLVIQRGAQLRFYERNAPGQWRSRDLYSIYTPSYQTGLALADVDGDGLTDILAGNYWVQSPKRWEESWHVFAINTWFEGPESASLRIVAKPDGAGEFAAQAHAGPARFGSFDRTPDPKQQWAVRPVAPELKWRNVHGLAFVGGRLVAGERAGAASRLAAIDPATGQVSVLNTGREVLTVLPLDATRFVTVEPDGVSAWRLPEDRRRRP